MKKRISVFILMMIMLVGVFGSVSVYAGEVDYSQAQFTSVCTQSNITYKSVSDGNEYSGVVYASHNIISISVDNYSVYGVADATRDGWISYYIVSDSPFTADITWSFFYYGFENSTIANSSALEYSEESGVLYYDESFTRTSSSYNGVYYGLLGESGRVDSSEFIEEVTVGSGYVFEMSESYKSTYSTNYHKYLINEILENYGDDVSQAPNVSIDEYIPERDFDESTATYERDLGYLKNVQFESLYLKFWDEVLNKFSTNPETGKYKIYWGSTSTSGVNLNDEKIFVRMYSQCAIYNKQHENICNNFPKNFIKQYSAGDGSLIIDIAEFLSYSQEDFDKVYNDVGYTKWHLNDYKRCDNIYLQLVRQNEDNSWSYGGYLKLSNNADGSVSGQPIAPDGGMDFESGGVQDVQSSTGVGDSYEEAIEDANQNMQEDVSDDLIKNAESLVSQIGEIPQLIAVLFSFLPPWCLTLFGVGFGLIVLLILYKLIRG